MPLRLEGSLHAVCRVRPSAFTTLHPSTAQVLILRSKPTLCPSLLDIIVQPVMGPGSRNQGLCWRTLMGSVTALRNMRQLSGIPVCGPRKVTFQLCVHTVWLHVKILHVGGVTSKKIRTNKTTHPCLKSTTATMKHRNHTEHAFLSPHCYEPSDGRVRGAGTKTSLS